MYCGKIYVAEDHRASMAIHYFRYIQELLQSVAALEIFRMLREYHWSFFLFANRHRNLLELDHKTDHVARVPLLILDVPFEIHRGHLRYSYG